MSTTPTKHTKSPFRHGRYWRLLTALLIPVFLGACASAPRSVRWIDPDFASGKIPVSHLELLPLSVAFNIDGVSPATWREVRRRHKQIAQQLEVMLQRSLSKKKYELVRGYMSRDRLYHLLHQVNRAAKVGNQLNSSVGVNPAIVAGGIPGTDAVLVVEGFANLTTSGKKAAQAAVVTLIVLTLVVVVAAMIYALTKSKGSKSSGSKARARGRRGRSKIRGSRSRFAYRTRGRRDVRTYRRRYFRRRGVRVRRFARGRRYFRGRYRHRGQWRRYRALRFRSAVAPRLFLYYLPHIADVARSTRHARPPNHKQPFFSGNHLDLSISMVEKGTGLLLWHQFHRFGINPSSPGQLRQTIHNLIGQLPMAQRIKRPVRMQPLPPGGLPQNPIQPAQAQPNGTMQTSPRAPKPAMTKPTNTLTRSANLPPVTRKPTTKKPKPLKTPKPTKEPLDPTQM